VQTHDGIMFPEVWTNLGGARALCMPPGNVSIVYFCAAFQSLTIFRLSGPLIEGWQLIEGSLFQQGRHFLQKL
jgi:hypothetical protein